MTDEDVLERFGRWAVYGTIKSRAMRPTKDHWKPQWIWQVSRQEHVVELIDELIDHMGSRRKAKMVEALMVVRDSSIGSRNWKRIRDALRDYSASILIRVEGGDADV